MIGYDLDGVLSQDFVWGGDVDELRDLRASAPPLFCPLGPYVIVTGRPSCDVEQAIEWLQQHRYRKPLRLFHERVLGAEQSVEYKMRVLACVSGLTDFVESSNYEALMLARKFPAIRVWWRFCGKDELVRV